MRDRGRRPATIRAGARRVWNGRLVTRRVPPVRGCVRIGSEGTTEIHLPTLRGARVILARAGRELTLLLYRRRRGMPRVSGRLVVVAPVRLGSSGSFRRPDDLDLVALYGLLGDSVVAARARGGRLSLTFGSSGVLEVVPCLPEEGWSLFGEGVPALGYVEPDRRALGVQGRLASFAG
jgi:hypothetical protein